MRHIVIFAASGAQNLGDELIVLSQVSMLHAHFPQAQIYVASHHPQSHLLADMQEYCHTFYAFPYAIKHYPWKNIQIFFEQILHILKSDLIII
jgi:ADP-heptose:LPS heptosyltransferase